MRRHKHPTVTQALLCDLMGTFAAVPSTCITAVVVAAFDAPTWAWVATAMVVLSLEGSRIGDRLLDQMKGDLS